MLPRMVGLLPLLLATSATAKAPITPSHDSARANAEHIFNEIHSAGRQWGSSVIHNGFGFFPAVLPRGTLLYHGTRKDSTPKGLEWLAFEVEHAELFSQSFRMRGRGPYARPIFGDDDDDSEEAVSSTAQKVLKSRRAPHSSSGDDGGGTDKDEEWNSRGYFHTYRVTRDLNVLYIDGMAAAKSRFGTLDSQDYLLRGNKTGARKGYMSEFNRATDVCDMATKWGLDGFIRAEIGFELVMCDFSQGLDLVTMTRSYLPKDKLGDERMMLFEMARAVGKGFDGLGDRLKIDFSGMVSGFFFPINISNTDPERPDLIRLGAASLDDLHDIKDHLAHVITQPRRFTVNWQAIVDAIVDRFADGIELLASGDIGTGRFLSVMARMTMLYFNAPSLPDDAEMHGGKNLTADAVDRCSEHYLLPALMDRTDWSTEDGLIYTAISTITEQVCETLISARMSLLEASKTTTRVSNADPLPEAIETTRQNLQDLMHHLGWTEWKRTRPCPIDQVWFVAMFPFGSKEDYYEPGCRTIEDLESTGRGGYWDMDDFVPPEDDDDNDNE